MRGNSPVPANNGDPVSSHRTCVPDALRAAWRADRQPALADLNDAVTA
ncbi:MAG: hypothetical protein H0X17_08860 [Deltaproteobacteria bacterium]|nr:hypothetical protein [Deltaproteobacteria bacterium]